MLSVHPLHGQGAGAFAARARDLAQSFGALACHAYDDPTGVVRLEVRRGDPLRSPLAKRRCQTDPSGRVAHLGRRRGRRSVDVSLP